eukprot:TRINITY_DN591_c0_g1_i1.p1 TRINITY_DN591_c0_g1~~TRINITY_DN591_c0_g1_i1.p1  ORF type:complete len:1378 (-),score=383.37 TRINITY_DN591_c0_g1_i1:59-4192(-)
MGKDKKNERSKKGDDGLLSTSRSNDKKKKKKKKGEHSGDGKEFGRQSYSSYSEASYSSENDEGGLMVSEGTFDEPEAYEGGPRQSSSEQRRSSISRRKDSYVTPKEKRTRPLDVIMQRLEANDRQLRELDLSKQKLDEKDGRNLSLALKDNTVLTKLDLSNNSLCEGGIVAIARVFSSNTTLTSINLSDNQLNKKGADALAANMSQNFDLVEVDLGVDQEQQEQQSRAIKRKTGLDVVNHTDIFSVTRQIVKVQKFVDQNELLAKCKRGEADMVRLGHRRFQTFPKILFEIPKLQKCDLFNNQLIEIPPRVKLLEYLEVLFLHHNHLRSLPHEIGMLHWLRKVDVSNNGLERVPDSLSLLPNLVELDLRKNRLQVIPEVYGTLTKLKKLLVMGNPLKGMSLPKDAMKRGDLAIHTYIKSQCLAGKRKCNRIKLMVMGNAAVGKTTLIKSLMVREAKAKSKKGDQIQIAELDFSDGDSVSSSDTTPSSGSVSSYVPIKQQRTYTHAELNKFLNAPSVATDGIEINQIFMRSGGKSDIGKKGESDGIIFYAWDFAGQSVYLTTHQYFIDKRAVYVVVFDVNDTKAKYMACINFWLQTIQTRAGSPPTLIVGTHVDTLVENKGKGGAKTIVKDIGTTINKNTKKTFPFVAGFFAISSKTQENVMELKRKLYKVASNQKFMHEAMPVSYYSLEAKLGACRDLRPQYPVLKWNSFYHLALSCNIPPKQVEAAARFLHDLGVIVSFHKYGARKLDDNNAPPQTAKRDNLGATSSASPDEIVEEDEDEAEGLAVATNCQALDEIVILDPQWLTIMFTSIVSVQTSFVKNGLLHAEDFPHIWKPPDYTPNTINHLVALLAKFELVFPLRKKEKPVFVPAVLESDALSQRTLTMSAGDMTSDDDDMSEDARTVVQDRRRGNRAVFEDLAHALDEDIPWLGNFDQLLVPSLLSPNAPSEEAMEKVWPTESNDRDGMYGRVYKFAYLPSGFFSRLVIRVMREGWLAKQFWSKGSVLHNLTGNRLFLQMKAEEAGGGGEVWFTANGPKSAGVLLDLTVKFETLINDWLRVPADIYVPYFEVKPPHMFPLRDLEELIGKGKKNVKIKGVTIPITFLVPDVSLECFPGVKIENGDLKNMNCIGNGAYGQVFKSMYKGQETAVKELKKPEGLSEFRREIFMLHVHRHPHLVNLIGICTSPVRMVMEYCDLGDLYEYIHTKKAPIDWELRLRLSSHIADGMRFLHSLSPPICHRDLKTPNILLKTGPDGKITAKIGDFGTCRSLTYVPGFVGSVTDNPVWLAPEILKNEHYDEKVDLYSFGVILWEILSKTAYFGEVKFWHVIEDKILKNVRPPIPDCKPGYKALIEELWSGNPHERPPFEECCRRLELLGAM